MTFVEQIENMENMDDFLNFICRLSEDYKENPEEWANTTITDYLGQIASWIDDVGGFDDNDELDQMNYKLFAKILYMGKIYE